MEIRPHGGKITKRIRVEEKGKRRRRMRNLNHRGTETQRRMRGKEN
jgi:hypothetical protein